MKRFLPIQVTSISSHSSICMLIGSGSNVLTLLLGSPP